MISDTDNLVNKSLGFIRALNKCYGTDEAHRIWEGVVDLLNDDGAIKFEVLKAILAGESEHCEWIQIRGPFKPAEGHKVQFIKLIRQISGEGLKDSKERADRLIDGQFEMEIIKIRKTHLANVDPNNPNATGEPPPYGEWRGKFKSFGLWVEFV